MFKFFLFICLQFFRLFQNQHTMLIFISGRTGVFIKLNQHHCKISAHSATCLSNKTRNFLEEEFLSGKNVVFVSELVMRQPTR